MRKRWNQISFLHLYHHAMMCVCPWIVLTYFPGGHGVIVGVVNSFIHTVMYTYYLATVYLHLKKSNLKKYVTQMQLVQFVFLFIYFSSSIVFPVESCTYPITLSIVIVIQNAVMIVMFGDFYVKTYMRKSNKKSK